MRIFLLKIGNRFRALFCNAWLRIPRQGIGKGFFLSALAWRCIACKSSAQPGKARDFIMALPAEAIFASAG